MATLDFGFLPVQKVFIHFSCATVIANVLGNVCGSPFLDLTVKETSLTKLLICIWERSFSNSGTLLEPVFLFFSFPGTFFKTLYICCRSQGISPLYIRLPFYKVSQLHFEAGYHFVTVFMLCDDKLTNWSLLLGQSVKLTEASVTPFPTSYAA